MTLKREDIKKLVIQEMLNEQLQQEAFESEWGSKALKAVGNKFTQWGQNITPTEKVDPQVIRKLGDFLQMAQRDRELSQLILKTDLGKKVFKTEDNKELEKAAPTSPAPVTEALGTAYADMIKKIKPTKAMVDQFISTVSANQKAKGFLKTVGLEIPKTTPKPSGTEPRPETDNSTKKPSTATSTARPAGGTTTTPAATASKPAASSGGPTNAGASTQTIPKYYNENDKVAYVKSISPPDGYSSLQKELNNTIVRKSNITKNNKSALITAILNDFTELLKKRQPGIKIRENQQQLQDLILSEMSKKLDKQTISLLLNEELGLDYIIASEAYDVLMEALPSRIPQKLPADDERAISSTAAAAALRRSGEASKLNRSATKKQSKLAADPSVPEPIYFPPEKPAPTAPKPAAPATAAPVPAAPATATTAAPVPASDKPEGEQPQNIDDLKSILNSDDVLRQATLDSRRDTGEQTGLRGAVARDVDLAKRPPPQPQAPAPTAPQTPAPTVSTPAAAPATAATGETQPKPAPADGGAKTPAAAPRTSNNKQTNFTETNKSTFFSEPTLDIPKYIAQKLGTVAAVEPKNISNIGKTIPILQQVLTQFISQFPEIKQKTNTNLAIPGREISKAAKSGTAPNLYQPVVKAGSGGKARELEEAIIEEIYNVLAGKNK